MFTQPTGKDDPAAGIARCAPPQGRQEAVTHRGAGLMTGSRIAAT
jgi:hypothetical protein